jgi:hypothetical protein
MQFKPGNKIISLSSELLQAGLKKLKTVLLSSLPT